MTIEQLLECSADDLEKMTDEQLLQHFTPYLEVTRPELAKVAKAKANVMKAAMRGGKASEEDEARKIMAQFGLNLNI